MAKTKLILAMLIFGSIGIIVTRLQLPSAVIALVRAGVGSLFLAAVVVFARVRVDWRAVRANAGLLTLSGAALGANWIFLFEAYRYTTVAVATLCYYMAPVFVILLSPLVLREKLTRSRLLCSAVAVCGAALISGAASGGAQDARGIAFGLAAAMLYCCIILINKLIRGLPPLETTLFQLAVSAVTLLPYVLFNHKGTPLTLTGETAVLLAVIGVVHTGIVYLLYFSSLRGVPAQTAAVFSYIDPVTAILLSAWLLRQPMNTAQLCGTALILGATFFNEALPRARVKTARGFPLFRRPREGDDGS